MAFYRTKLFSTLSITAFIAMLGISVTAGPGSKRKHPHPINKSGTKVLNRMITGENRINMSGHRVTKLPNGKTVDESVVRQGGKVRVDYGTGSKGEVLIDHGQKAWLSHNHGKSWVEINSPRKHQLENLIQKVQNGQISMEMTGKEAVAGRSADILSFYNRNHILTERLWVDDPSGLVLKREHYDKFGSVKGSFAFDKVAITPANAVNPQTLAVTGKIDGKNYRKLETLVQESPFPVYQINAASLPTGLIFKGGRIRQFRGKTLVSMHFQGGGHQLTFIQAQGNKEQDLPKRSGKNLVMHTYFWEQGDHVLGLISNLTEEELRRIASSVK